MVFAPAQMLGHADGGADVAESEPGMTLPEDGIEVFLGGMNMINPGDGAVEHTGKALVAQIVVETGEELAGVAYGDMDVHNESAISEAIMRDKRGVATVGGEQGVEPALAIEHQRPVIKAVGMILHIVALKEEGGVAGTAHVTVPALAVVGGISSYLKHLIVCSAGILRSHRYNRPRRRGLRQAPGIRLPTRNRRECARCRYLPVAPGKDG